MTRPDTSAKYEARFQRASVGRILLALCIAGLAAGGLSGDVSGAGADNAQVPGEPVASRPAEITQAPATVAPGADAANVNAATSASSSATGNRRAKTQQPSAKPPSRGPARAAVRIPAPRPRAQVSPVAVPAAPPVVAAAAIAPAAPAAAKAPASTRSGAGTTSKPKARTCVASSGGRAQRGSPSAGRGQADQAKRGGIVKSAQSAKSARTGCRQPAAGAAGTRKAPRDRARTAPLRTAGGVPTVSDPTTSLASPGPAPVGVPNFFIDKFRIPPFLLPIYQAAGIQYGIRWEVLAAINEIETDYGRNLNVSTAGALGWMQFMPGTWKTYGVDANRDGRKDPFNPVDAIFAAARYLKAAGGDTDVRKGIFAYNHADWYVNSVLLRARMIGGLPDDLIGSLSGLTQGHFPVAAKARYADDLTAGDMRRRVKAGQNAAMPVESSGARRNIDIYAAEKSPVIAVQDGEIIATGRSKRLGSYVRLRDVYGNTYTYANLKSVAKQVPVPKLTTQSQASIAKELALPTRDPKPTRAASAGRQRSGAVSPKAAHAAPRAAAAPAAVPSTPGVTTERLFAHPTRRNALPNGGARQLMDAQSALAEGKSLHAYIAGAYGLRRKDVVLKPLAAGRRVIAGTILGRIGATSKTQAPHLSFEIRPAGRGAPRIDPKPILDGWKLLESTAIYRAQGKNALVGPDAPTASIGQIMLMSKETLARRVLSDPRIDIYSCGRHDIEAGGIDRRVLATLEFLAGSGLKPTVSSLRCGHGYLTTSGNVSEHSSGNAVDIAKINGIPILGHQGVGSITDITIRRLLTLQGTAKPHQIISLMTYKNADNTLALPDHYDHIHVGFRPQFVPGSRDARQLEAVLKPAQWIKLIDRLGQITNPTVLVKPSKYAVPVPVTRASQAHRGE